MMPKMSLNFGLINIINYIVYLHTTILNLLVVLKCQSSFSYIHYLLSFFHLKYMFAWFFYIPFKRGYIFTGINMIHWIYVSLQKMTPPKFPPGPGSGSCRGPRCNLSLGKAGGKDRCHPKTRRIAWKPRCLNMLLLPTFGHIFSFRTLPSHQSVWTNLPCSVLNVIFLRFREDTPNIKMSITVHWNMAMDNGSFKDLFYFLLQNGDVPMQHFSVFSRGYFFGAHCFGILGVRAAPKASHNH